VGPRAGLDGCGKISLPPGFDLRTVQPVTSHYTDCATRPMHTHRHMPVLIHVLSSHFYLLSNFCEAFSLDEKVISLWDVIILGIVC
jgi:hypothetical protein